MSKSPSTNGFLAVLRKDSLLGTAFIAIVLSVLYWSLIASDRYVSEAHVIIQSTDMTSSSTDLGTLLGVTSTGQPTEQLLLRDYLKSIDMLKKLDTKLDLRRHYAESKHDLLSRLWFEDVSMEMFYSYIQNRISIEYDDYAGVLIIKAQAYDPATAHAIAEFLVSEGEQFMNSLARGLAQEQVNFLTQEIEKIHEDTIQSRQALLAFQNKYGMVSPQATTQNIAGTINSMENQLTQLQTTRSAMLGYLMPNSTNIIELNLQIEALQKQIANEKARLTSPVGKTLNSTVEAYQRLEMNAQFSQAMYQSAMTALEKGRFEASRTLKKMSILQAPTLPEYSLEPRRLYNSILYIVVILIITGIAHLIGAIIRDHKD